LTKQESRTKGKRLGPYPKGSFSLTQEAPLFLGGIMTFESIIAEFGKPLHEMSEEDILAIAQRLDAPELERFEAHVKEVTKKPREKKLNKTAQEGLDFLTKLKLQAKKESSDS
jgi:hypothetical protein